MWGAMEVHRLRRVALIGTSVVMVATVASGALASPAWAHGKPVINCTGFSGSVAADGTSTGNVWGCSGKTGGTGTFTSGSLNDSPTWMMITWANSTTTGFRFVAPAAAKDNPCPAAEFKIKASGRVTSDTDRSTRGWRQGEIRVLHSPRDRRWDFCHLVAERRQTQAVVRLGRAVRAVRLA